MDSTALEFEKIYVEYYPPIHRYLIRLIGAKDAEDLTQEVFVKVAQTLNLFRNEAKVSTWLYRIATNTAIDRMREASFRREIVSGECETTGTDLNVCRTSLEEKIVHKATNDCIRGVIEDLPDNYRLPVILSELEGLPNQEIAEILGVSLDAVKVRLHRGKARLKKELSNYCHFSRDERNELTCDPKAAKTNKLKDKTQCHEGRSCGLV
ncbi:MAG TPA: RNA polymerase sigma factor [Negativicutes bacterium]|nr:RNA polymerase sigma factor [Negativicutes bacterium]